MSTLRRLKDEARNTATWRGHDMARFRALTPGRSAESRCKKCHRTVHVDTKPAPNGIDIGGEAVALNCR
jgi:hypothetical protein